MTRVLVVGALVAGASVAFSAWPLEDTRSPVKVDSDGFATLTESGALAFKAREFHAARAQLALAEWSAAQAEQQRQRAQAQQQEQEQTRQQAQPDSRWSADWDAIAECETGGDWQMSGPTFSGGLGFANTTWSGYGGGEFASNAGSASREQQIIVAERVYDEHGLSGWGCRAYG